MTIAYLIALFYLAFAIGCMQIYMNYKNLLDVLIFLSFVALTGYAFTLAFVHFFYKLAVFSAGLIMGLLIVKLYNKEYS